MAQKILIIKLGALGDVIRTLPLAKAIKENFSDSEITWITKENALELFENNPYVKRVFTDKNYPKESFNLLYNFDIDNDATKIALEINAEKKYGFYQENGYPLAFNTPAEYYLNTIFDDNLKKINKKTYQEMMFDIAELPYCKEIAPIFLNEKDIKFSERFLEDNQINKKKLIGIHMGASPRWPSKIWDLENIKEFIKKAKQRGYEILLFGGPNEIDIHEKFAKELETEGIKVYRNNPQNSLKEFASLVNLCNQMICSDSFSLHVSLALKKPTICLFFCTPPNEIESYDILKKIISPKLNDFFPEKMNEYDRDLTKSISADEVLDALEKNNPVRVVNAIVKHPKENKFLIIKRKEGIHENKWAFPGGIIKEGENHEIAIKRELKEETGLELKNIIRKISDYSYLRPDRKNTIGNSYLVEVKDDNVSINEEIQEYKWVTIEEFEDLDYIEGLEEEIFNAFYT